MNHPKTRNVHNIRNTAIALAVALLLTACGGGEEPSAAISSQGASGSTQLLAGQSIQISGQISAPHNILTSMKWIAQADSPSSPSLILSNDNCDLATKNDTRMPTKSSDWSCKLGVIAPSNIASVSSYTLTLNGILDNGNSINKTQKVTVSPNTSGTTSGSLIASAGPGFSVTSGQSAPLNCSGPKEAIFQWRVAQNSGLAISLSSYNTSGTSFTAPAVSSPKTVTLQCLATDDGGSTTTSNIDIVVNPVVNSNTLVASISSPANAKPGETIALTSIGNWFDQTGNASTGPVPTYNWSFTSSAGSTTGFNLFSSTGESNSLYIPANISSPTTISVNLNAVAGTASSNSTVNILVSPNPALTPNVNPASQVITLGTTGAQSVSIDATSGSNLFYNWTQISGPAVTIGGANTAKMGFTTPNVASQTDLVFRAAMSYDPITSTNTGVYFIDAVVTIKP